jgi:hypothetical protein
VRGAAQLFCKMTEQDARGRSIICKMTERRRGVARGSVSEACGWEVARGSVARMAHSRVGHARSPSLIGGHFAKALAIFCFRSAIFDSYIAQPFLVL